MNRRTFIKLGGMTLSAAATLSIIHFLQSNRPSKPTQPVTNLEPTQTTAIKPTATSLPLPSNEPTMPPQSPSSTSHPQAPHFLLQDQFTDDLPAGRINGSLATDQTTTRQVHADNALQVSISGGALHIVGHGNDQNAPLIGTDALFSSSTGFTFGTRFKVGQGKTAGRLGLLTSAGQPTATLRRTDREFSGGVIEFGEQAFPALTLYSNCWYDFVTFVEDGMAAVAINEGAGLELVLVTDQAVGAPVIAGYSTLTRQDQQVAIDRWYAVDALTFPPLLISQAAPSHDFQIDLHDNAAWVETRVTWAVGQAGLRFRSLDRDNEYRVYFDGNNLKVDQVIDGAASMLLTQPVSFHDGSKLAIRYNELTLTIYLDNQLVGQSNLKIGAARLTAGTFAGTYSTSSANRFQDFSARLVRLQTPDILRSQLLISRRVLCLGDSLTSADFALGYQNRLRKSLGEGWVTLDGGVSGQTTWQMLSRLPAHLEHLRPDVVVAMGGTNDVHHGNEASAIIANLQSIYTRSQQSGARVAAVTIPPLRGYASWTGEKQAVLEQVNDWIRTEAQNVDFRIDAFRALETPGTGALQPEYDGSDHLHLSGQGYARLADEILYGVAW